MQEVLPVGAIVGQYRIQGIIGGGGSAKVYRATHHLLGSIHAVKILLVHDIVEIDAGDAFIYDDAKRAEAESAEPSPLTKLLDWFSDQGPRAEEEPRGDLRSA